MVVGSGLGNAFLGSGIDVDGFACGKGKGSEGPTLAEAAWSPVAPQCRRAVASEGGRQRPTQGRSRESPCEGLPVPDKPAVADSSPARDVFWPAAADALARRGCSGSGGLRIQPIPHDCGPGRTGEWLQTGSWHRPFAASPQWQTHPIVTCNCAMSLAQNKAKPAKTSRTQPDPQEPKIRQKPRILLHPRSTPTDDRSRQNLSGTSRTLYLDKTEHATPNENR